MSEQANPALLRLAAAVVVGRNSLYETYKIVNGLNFRHSSVECNCPVCQDIRNAMEPLGKLLGEVLERLEELAVK